FSQSAVPFVAANANEITEAVVNSLPMLTGVTVSGESAFGGSVDITFTYNDQDNNDLIGNFGAYMAQMLSTQFSLDGFAFVQGFGGPKGSQGDPNADTEGLKKAFGDISTTAIVVAVAVVVVVVAIKFA